MHYANIKYNDIANGDGVRTSLFVSGCRNRCENCFNKATWDFKYGSPFTDEIGDKIIESLLQKHISGLTILGGEPMEPENQEGLLPFVKKVKSTIPDKTIWLYTGYVLDEDLVAGGKRYTKHTSELLKYVDIIVDGPYIESLKDLSLRFRGSSNQRIIELK